MKYALQFLVFMFMVTDMNMMPVQSKEIAVAKQITSPKIILESEVFIGGQLPQWGVVCRDSNVLGNPYGLGEPIRQLKTGDMVRLHELSQSGEAWVMIEQAEWISLDSLCLWTN